MVTQTRAYNERNQMTRQTVTGQMDIEYFYSATNNDGRLTGTRDAISGEKVLYRYDELGRMICARQYTTDPLPAHCDAQDGSSWGNSYVFDGFGNLKQKDVTKGVAPTLSLQIDGSTNRIAAGQGFGYDNNGNLTTRPGQTLSYDIDNRLAQVTYSGGSETYAYYANNQRMKKGDTYYFYGTGGEELGTFTLVTYQGETNPKWVRGRVKVQSISAMWINGELQYSDRLGSVVRRGGVTQRYYPYGEDRDPGAAGPKHFATYEKDDATGLHYAQQRYYENSVGRFLSPDPYQASGGPSDPGSWNRYSYVGGDPINYGDPEGLQRWMISIWGVHCVGFRDDGGVRCYPWEYHTYYSDGEAIGGSSGAPADPQGPGTSHAPSLLDPKTLPGWFEAFSLTMGALALPDCARHFGLSASNMNPSTLLTGATFAQTTTTALFFSTTTTPGIAAQTSWQGIHQASSNPHYYFGSDGRTRIESTRVSIDINTAVWNSLDVISRSQLLIHELGHVFNMLMGAGGSHFVYDALPDGKPDPVSQAVNSRLEQDCIRRP